MKKSLLSLIAISLLAMGCLSFAQDKDWIEYSGSDIIVYSPDGYGIVIQDRNLWATTTWGWKNAPSTSYWNYYQWWNNYGFPSDPDVTITTSSDKVDTSGYWPDNPYSDSTFIKWSATYDSPLSDWSSVRNDNLWWGIWDDEINWWWLISNNPITGRQWPCPNWYHIPSIWELDELAVIWYNNKYNDNISTWYLIEEVALQQEDVKVSADFSEDLFIPLSSLRWLIDWTVDTDYYGLLGNLWSSSPYSEIWFTLSLTILNWRSSPSLKYALYADVGNYRSDALPIRCFKNEHVYRDTSKTLTLNVLSGENVISTWVSFTNDEPLTSGQVFGAIDWLSNEIDLATGYHFEWYADNEWVETGFNLDEAVSEGTITWSLALTWKIEPNKYTISFLDENGAEIMSGEFTYNQEATLPTNMSSKEWYTFKWWKDGQWNIYEDWATIKNLTAEDGAVLEFSPIREKQESKPSGGSSWWGGRWWSEKATDSQTDDNKIADDKKSDEKPDSISENSNNNDTDGLEVVNYNPDLPAEQQTLSDGLTPEMHRAYKFAFKHGITTMPTNLEADMFGPLDRISMAKMLSQYAINVLWKTPDTSIEVPTFPDITPELNKEFWNAVTLAYQLWIMWINIDEFRPFDLVPRSEFGTALSRMLYQTSDWIYEKTDIYYTLHFQKLKEKEIMTILDPNIQELRWYVMIMLMRSAGENN